MSEVPAARPRLGFIGLGRMGSRMAARLIDAGYPLTVYNRNRGRTGELERRGAHVAGAPVEVGRSSDFVVTMVADSNALRAVTVGHDGVLAGLARGSVLIDMSTVAPSASMQVAAAADSAGVRFLRAPVMGSTGAAEQGTLGILVSGDEAAFREAEPFLSVFGPKHFYLGSGEQARYMKLAVNMMVGITVQMLAEALVFAEKAGLPWAETLDVINNSVAASPTVKLKTAMIADHNYEAAFTVRLMQKDFGLALDAARDLGVPIPVTSLAHELQTAAVERGLGQLDFAAVHLLMRELAGLSAAAAKVETNA